MVAAEAIEKLSTITVISQAILVSGAATTGLAPWHGKLFHIDLNGQHGPRYEQDLRFGAGNACGAFWVVDALEAAATAGWSISATSRREPRTTQVSGHRRPRACAAT
jgi:xylose isomerase